MIELNNKKNIFVSFYTADEKLRKYEFFVGEKSKNRDKLIQSRTPKTVPARSGHLECMV